MDRNPNITVTTRKRNLDYCLTSRIVHFVLPSIVQDPEVSIITSQES